MSATCKNDASINYSTCLSSGKADESACLQQYNSALVQFKTPTLQNNTDCVTRFTQCEKDGKDDALCQSDNAQCKQNTLLLSQVLSLRANIFILGKTDCSTSYSTCLSSGDPTLAAPCMEQYNFCLVTFAWNTNATIPTGQDCVSKYMSSTGEDNERNAKNAQCKTACSTSYSTCLSSGDGSLGAPCLMQYNLCLVDFKSTITTPDCASSYLTCDDAENTCAANAASCKNTCSVALDTCQSSGDSALHAPCQKQYQTCLVSFTPATSALGEDCVASFLSCREAGGADNTCSSVSFPGFLMTILLGQLMTNILFFNRKWPLARTSAALFTTLPALLTIPQPHRKLSVSMTTVSFPSQSTTPPPLAKIALPTTTHAIQPVFSLRTLATAIMQPARMTVQ